jgi:large subunit ribosomal protein L25
MAVSNLTAQKRDDLANAGLKSNRKKGNIPGVFYFKGNPSVPIYVKEVALNPFIFTSDVKIINLQIEGGDKPYNCILKDIQFDPVSDRPVHFDLLGVSENEKINIEIPLVLVGAPAGVKDGGIIQHTLHTVEVECLPKDIPSHIDIDISSLQIGDSVQIKDIILKNFEILDNPEATIVSVVPPAVEKVETPVVEGEEAAEPEVITKGKKDEDEAEEEGKGKGK